ncbi:putative carboxylesterase 13 [Citrus sinensis]|uniref:probable carboxylesterase 13 n=1 Tax=Citrus sinensis TaxID=2711 RepID=UPI0021969738|nr:probable carboxylesterase 13 [Citrus sinensis]KAH9656244.1 putative carboxylesterase 13 [Citrus sinensis]
MDSTKPSSEIAYEFSPLIRVYKDGRVERFVGNDTVPPSFDPKTNVDSKDVVYSPQNSNNSNALSARLYLPKGTNNNNNNNKLPLLVYIHGGGFCIETAFSLFYHSYLNALVSACNVVAVSVDYRRAPENPVPCAHDDSWAAIKWVASHVNGSGPEDWLNRYADFQRVFFAGDSAGANIAHHMGIRNGREILDGFNVAGIVLVHPYFWGSTPVGNETTDAKHRAFFDGIWRMGYRSETNGCDDPWINPCVEGSSLASMGCARVLVFVAEKDKLAARGWLYYEKLKESGWKGRAEIVETKGESHVFHLFNPNSENARVMLQQIASFFNLQDKP